MTDETLGFIHRFEPGSDTAHPLLLLHGTGGDETDLLPLGRMLAPNAPLLSPRGAVSENGMPRFFRRLAEGVFDEADLRRRTQDLAGFVAAARDRYGSGAPLALGFSNGANIAAALLMLRPEILAGAVLLRPMVPFADPPVAELAGKPVLILSGAMDPIVPVENARRLAAQLTAAGAQVEHRILPAGHGLSQAEVSLAAGWLETVVRPRAA
ncbi:MAG: alpha/beta hydrolase [Actinomycetospora chiangmaiensis]|nr:alpha/beta hydrolase [Actinomycetospora chiangmaiensis]